MDLRLAPPIPACNTLAPPEHLVIQSDLFITPRPQPASMRPTCAVRLRAVLRLRRPHEPERRHHPQAQGVVHAHATPRRCWSSRRSSPPISWSRSRPPCWSIAWATCAPPRIGLAAMTAGCLLFVPASASRSVPGLPVCAVRARQRHHHRAGRGQSADLHARPAADGASRLTFAQAFNSLGTTCSRMSAPLLILGSLRQGRPRRSPARRSTPIARQRDARHRAHLFAAWRSRCAWWPPLVWQQRRSLVETRGDTSPSSVARLRAAAAPRFAFGAAVHLSLRRRGGGDRLAHRELT